MPLDTSAPTERVPLHVLFDTAPASPRRGKNYLWNTAELRTLDANWTTGGIEACMALLPGRTPSAIYSQAHARKLTSLEEARRKLPRAIYDVNPWIDDQIRHCWETGPARGEVKKLSHRVLRSRSWIKSRAVVLGLSRIREKEADWGDAEKAFASARAHHTLAGISTAMRRQGWRRSPTAIGVMLKRLGQSRIDPEAMSAREVASLMGCEAHAVVRWIEKLGLPATRRGTERTEKQGGDTWTIKRRPLRDWIAANPAAVNLRRVDQLWFIELMVRP